MTTNRTANQEKALSIKESSIIISNDEQNLSHNEGLESERKPGKQIFDWQIISIKIVCFVLIVISWLIVATPYASLVRYFLSSDVSSYIITNLFFNNHSNVTHRLILQTLQTLKRRESTVCVVSLTTRR